MAKDNGNGTVTVEKGDSLWSIANAFLGGGNKYQRLASWNNIKDPYIIVVGQVLKIRSSNDPVPAPTPSNKAKVTAFGLQAGSDNTIYAKWEWTKSNTDHYQVRWWYGTSDNQGFVGSDSTTEHAHATYSPPANATKVTFMVKPISKTYTKNNATTSYWTADWSTNVSYYMKDNPPSKPSGEINVKIENHTLTASLYNQNVNAADIEFQVVADDKTIYKTGYARIYTGAVSFSCTIELGKRYKVRCRSIRHWDMLSSDWTDYTANIGTIPSAPENFTVIKTTSATSVYLEWPASDNTKSYKIEYTTKKNYFDNASNEVQKLDNIEFNHVEITGLTGGIEYFFRRRSVNDYGESPWSPIESIVIGKKPSAPTTWSSTTTCVTGEELILYWVHNSEDGSSQTLAELQLYIDDDEDMPAITIKNSEDDEEKDRTSSYIVDTSVFPEGTKIRWKVRTAGITYNSPDPELGGYGDWSIERTVDIYAPPTLSLVVSDKKNGDPINILYSFPLYINAVPGPKTQSPIGYHLSVIANEAYTTVDEVGNEKNVGAGEEVYSRFFDVSNESLSKELSAGDINLEVGISYRVTCVVSMNSGLTASASSSFIPLWMDTDYSPDAEIGYDSERYTAQIRPYCSITETVFYEVEYSFEEKRYLKSDRTIDGERSIVDAVYTTTGERVFIGVNALGLELYYCAVYMDDAGNPIDAAYYEVVYSSGVYSKTNTVIDISEVTEALTDTGDIVYLGIDNADIEVYHCITEETKLVEDMTLSLYRREFDGSFTEIATGLDNTANTYVTDPHPALDYARYRVVARTNSTGDVSYYDVPGYPTGEKAVIIQWDEEWSNFNTEENSVLTEPTWAGSLLRLPYNIDISDANSPDVTLINYIGRKRPVSYYGTHLGETATWNVEIPKYDKDTLYAIRRLAIWMGDVYVREPSGTGYWANIKVSYSQKHKEVTIPITLSITRVEGGM